MIMVKKINIWKMEENYVYEEMAGEMKNREYYKENDM